MKKKVLSILFVLVLVLSFSLVAAVPAGAVAGEVWVDGTGGTTDHYATIQEGINAVESGGTVHVAAGIYEVAKGDVFFSDHYGLKIDDTKSGITLSGANAGIPGTGTRVSESIIEGPRVLHGNAIFIFNDADGVIVDGFTLRAYDDIVENRADDVVIKNNIIEPLPSSSLTGTLTFTNGSNIVTGSGTAFNTELAVEWKIMLDADGVWVQVGSIQSDTSLTLEWGPYTGTGGTGTGSTHPDAHAPGIFACEANNLTVRNNLIQAGGCGLFLGLPGFEAPVTNSLIEYNLIDNPGCIGILAFDTDNILISHNTIRDAGTPEKPEDGIRAGALGSDLTIEYNDIYGCSGCGIKIIHAAATHSIHNNNIVGNAKYGVENTDTADSVDAINNWWGAASGPYHPTLNTTGLGNAVSDYVTYHPWLVSGPGSEGTTPCSGTIGAVSSVIVVTAPGAVSFGTFSIGENSAASGIDGYVTYTQGNDGAGSWQVTAKDNNQADDTGHMLRAIDSHPLTNELLISGDEGSTYSDASGTPPLLTYTGTVSGAYTFDAKQVIESGDPVGNYSSTIKFIGTLTF